MPTKAIALFMSAEENSAVSDHQKQNLCRDFAERHQLAIVGFFAIADDAAQSVRYALEQCLKGVAKALIIDEPETVTVAHKDMHHLLKNLREENIELGFISHDLMLSREAIDVFFRLLTAGGQAERVLRSTSIKKSLNHKKQKGLPLGGRKFGARPEESTIVRQILKLHADGLSLQKICDLLAHHDIKTIQNKKWYPTTVKRIIERAEKASTRSRKSR